MQSLGIGTRLLPEHIPRFLILAQGNKLGMAEMAIRSPFDKFKLSQEHGKGGHARQFPNR
jgi:hypothetical protein